MNNKSNDQLSIQELENEQKLFSSKGEQLEYQIKRLFFYMGYYAEANIILKSSIYNDADIITDLDVYGIYIHRNFTNRRIWADCKSGKVKPLERISWIRGVRGIVRAEDIYFVKRNVRSTTKSFAKRSGIQVLDETIINKLEKDFDIAPVDWRGSWSPSSQKNRISELNKLSIFKQYDLKRIASFISSGYWALDDFSRTKKCISGLQQLSDCINLPNYGDNTTIKWAIYKLITLFTLSVLGICKDVYYLADAEKKAIISDGLISGEVSPQKRKEIVDATYKMAISMVKQEIPDYQPKSFNYDISITPPAYHDKFQDLIKRMTNNPLEYYDILRALDFSLMEYDLTGKPYSIEELEAMFPNYSNLVNGIKTVLHFISDVCSIPKSLLYLIYKK